ncbi:MAG: hypothetical protein ACRC2R_10205 [Xenococcaceae cyanobacterium]
MSKNLSNINTYKSAIVQICSIAFAFASINSVTAQQIPQSVINGLSTPNSAQDFFNEGTQMLEQEERILNEQKFRSGEQLLKITKVTIEPQVKLKRFKQIQNSEITGLTIDWRSAYANPSQKRDR